MNREQNCCLSADSCMSLHTRGDSCDRRLAQSREHPPHPGRPWSPVFPVTHPAPCWHPPPCPGHSGSAFPDALEKCPSGMWVHIHSLLNCQIVFHCMGVAVQLKDPGAVSTRWPLRIIPCKPSWAVSTRWPLRIIPCKPSCCVELLWPCNNYLGMELTGHT